MAEAKLEVGELHQVLEELTAGERHAECCICFEPLHEEATCTLTQRGTNACAHFFHQRCALELLRSDWAPGRLPEERGEKPCPICRRPFDGVRAVPKISDDPNGWWFCVDSGRTGKLTRQEVINVLVTQFPLDTAKLEAHLPTFWSRWDQDESGAISREEFLEPTRGLLNFVRANLLHEETDPPSVNRTAESSAGGGGAGGGSLGRRRWRWRRRQPRSSLGSDSQFGSEEGAAAWFHRYDESGNGLLTRDQLLRALVQSVPACTLADAERVVEQLSVTIPELRQRNDVNVLARVLRKRERITLAQFLSARVYLHAELHHLLA